MIEFRILRFANSASGQNRKVEVLRLYAAAGWRVAGETVTQGRFKTGEACCLALIWPPLGFLAGHEQGWITVTLQRDAGAFAESAEFPVGLYLYEMRLRQGGPR